MSLCVATVGSTAMAYEKFAIFADTSAATIVVIDAYSYSTVVEKPSKPSATSAATPMETTAINADSDDEEEEVTLRRIFFNAGGDGVFGVSIL